MKKYFYKKSLFTVPTKNEKLIEEHQGIIFIPAYLLTIRKQNKQLTLRQKRCKST